MMIAAVRVGFFRKVEIPHLSLPQCCFLLWDLDVSGKEERDKQKVDFADQTFVSKILFLRAPTRSETERPEPLLIVTG
jgi:hypothetical protein